MHYHIIGEDKADIDKGKNFLSFWH